jgi:hypothetical protein
MLIVMTLAAGCACEHSKPAATQPTTNQVTVIYRAATAELITAKYRPATAGSLAFDPPVTRNEAPLDLARSGREPAAFAGYDEGVAEYFLIRVDDRQSYDNTGLSRSSSSNNNISTGDSSTYQRRTITEISGVRYR